MSIEFQLAYTCPHQMIREPAVLGEDGRTLQTSQTCVGGIEVYMNGTQVPSEGLHSNAKLVSGVVGPYRIYPDARTFGITFEGITKEVELDVGVHKCAKIAHLLNKLFDGLSVTDKGGRLFFEDNLNIGSTSKINLSGSALQTTGFDKRRAAQGKTVVPPWGVGLRDGYLTVAYPQFFSRPKQANNARFEVTYFTEAHRCRRCMATRVENDLRYDQDGLLDMIKDEDHLYQACLKALLTKLGTNLQHKWYGSSIMEMIGSKANGAVVSAITQEIRRVLDSQIAMQSKQSEYQPVTMKERLYRVVSVNVQQHRKDKTVFLCEVIVQNYSGTPVRLSIVYTAPEAFGSVRKDGTIVNSLGGY